MEGYLQPPKGEKNKNWKKAKRLIFKSTKFGDDNDRALQKDDGSWTYFANDLAYHMDKVSRNYNNLVNILGSDHTGYTKRITAAVSALSENKLNLIVEYVSWLNFIKVVLLKCQKEQENLFVQDLLSEVERDNKIYDVKQK